MAVPFGLSHIIAYLFPSYINCILALVTYSPRSALVPLVSRRSLRVFPPVIHYASAATRGTSRTKRGEDRGAAAVV